jgi:hypothetical protein
VRFGLSFPRSIKSSAFMLDSRTVLWLRWHQRNCY